MDTGKPKQGKGDGAGIRASLTLAGPPARQQWAARLKEPRGAARAQMLIQRAHNRALTQQLIGCYSAAGRGERLNCKSQC